MLIANANYHSKNIIQLAKVPNQLFKLPQVAKVLNQMSITVSKLPTNIYSMVNTIYIVINQTINGVQFTLLILQVPPQKKVIGNCQKCYFYKVMKLSNAISNSQLPTKSIYPQTKSQCHWVKNYLCKVNLQDSVY